MDDLQTYRRLKMPVQMIELEEMTMVEASDDILETSVTAGGVALSHNPHRPIC